MSLIIECTDRSWDVENVTRALELPVKREYVGRLTVDDHDAHVVFDADVQFLWLDQHGLIVQRWDEATGDAVGDLLTFDPADIRRIEFY